MSEKTYTYRDEKGKPLFRQKIVRFPDGDKKPYPQRFEKNKWISGLTYKDEKGKSRWIPRKILYNLQALYKTRNTDKAVWIVEGEKCVDVLKKLGLIATCTYGGSSGKWKKSYGAYMKDRPIYVLSDNDEMGMKYAEEMARGALSVAGEVRIVVPWGDKDAGFDVADWIDGHPKPSKKWLIRQLRKYKEQSPVCTVQDSLRFKLHDLEEVAHFEDPEFLIQGILPAGCFAVLYSPPKTGKSFLALSWAGAVQTGNSWLNLYKTNEGQVVYIVAEGGRGDWKLRIEALQKRYKQGKLRARLNKMRFIFDQPLIDTGNVVLDLIETLRQIEPPPSLVVFDTKARTTSGSENVNEDAAKYIGAIDKIRTLFNCTVLVIHHTPHTTPTRPRGASALMGAADILLRIKKPDKDSGLAKVICDNSRCCEPFEDIYIELISVDVNKDKDLTSLRIVPGYKTDWVDEKAKAIDKNTEQIIEALKQKDGLNSKELQQASGLKSTIFKKTKNYMVDNALIENRGTENKRKWYLL